MKRIAIAAAAAALTLPSAALAQDSTTQTNASKTCKSQRTAMGAQAFKDLYGTNKNKSNAFGKCVSKAAKAEQTATTKAKSTCKTEQDDPNFAANHGGKTFAQFYGTNKNGKNAYGKCVSSKAKAQTTEESKATVNAAKTCKAERKSLGTAAFNQKYGTNKNKKNAFGKCVSAHAKKPYAVPAS
jgi:hypothetical protein